MGLSTAVEKATANPASGLDGFSISQTAIMKWEKGESVPTVDNLVAIAATLYPKSWPEETMDIIESGVSLSCIQSTWNALAKSYTELMKKAEELGGKRAQILEEQIAVCAELEMHEEVKRLAEEAHIESERHRKEIESYKACLSEMQALDLSKSLGSHLKEAITPDGDSWDELRESAISYAEAEASKTPSEKIVENLAKGETKKLLEKRIGKNTMTQTLEGQVSSTAREE